MDAKDCQHEVELGVRGSKDKPWPHRGEIQCSRQWMHRAANIRLNSACVAARISPGHTGVQFSARDYTKRDMLCQTQYARLIRVRSTELNTQYNAKHTDKTQCALQRQACCVKRELLCQSRRSMQIKMRCVKQNTVYKTNTLCETRNTYGDDLSGDKCWLSGI